MLTTLFVTLFFANPLSADFKTLETKSDWRPRLASYVKLWKHKHLSLPASLSFAGHDPSALHMACKLRDFYREWYFDPLPELPGGRMPWISMVHPRGECYIWDADPPVLLLPKGFEGSTANELYWHYFAEHVGDGRALDWSHDPFGYERRPTWFLCRDLLATHFRADVMRLLRRMAELEALYTQRMRENMSQTPP